MNHPEQPFAPQENQQWQPAPAAQDLLPAFAVHDPGQARPELATIRAELLHGIEQFASPDAPAARLFEYVDPGLAQLQDPLERLRAYEELCEVLFDFRGGFGKFRERAEAAAELKKPREEVGAELWDLAFEVCAAHNMTESSELQDGEIIRTMGILGGAPAGIMNRTKYAVDQLQRHGATTGSLDYLITAGELPAAQSAMKEVLQLSGEPLHTEEVPTGKILHCGTIDLNGSRIPVRILVANPKPDAPQGRATTLDTLTHWQAVEQAPPDAHMVTVTTEFFTEFQRRNAEEVVRWNGGPHIKVIGHSAAWAGGQRTANQLLQEFKAAIDSRWRLLEKMVATGLVPELPAHYEVRNPAAMHQPVPDMRAARFHKPGYSSEPIDTHHPRFQEPMAAIAEYGLAGQAYYSRPNAATGGEPIPGVAPDLYLRRSIAQDLAHLNQALQNPFFTQFFGGEVELYLEDALRNITTQQEIHDELVPALLRAQNPGIRDDEVASMLHDIIAVPRTNPAGPSPHLTGGAFDIGLRFKQPERGFVPGAKLEMGHHDAETSPRLYPDHFEHHPPTNPEDAQAQRNRRAFMAIMTGAVFGRPTGFRVNPTEIFHWSRGDQLAARVAHSGGDSTVRAYYSIPEEIRS